MMNAGDRLRGFAGQEMGGGKAGASAVQLEPETQAFLARFGNPPSDVYKQALDAAIRRWKAAGVFSLLQDLWLLCADTKADSVRNLIASARDAVTIGAPTFTPLAGFGGLSTTSYVRLPFSTSSITTGSAIFAAGKFDPSQADQLVVGEQNKLGSLKLWNGDPNYGLGPGYALRLVQNTGVGSSGIGTSNFVLGHMGVYSIAPGTLAFITANLTGVTASPLAINNAGGGAVITQVSAYAVAPTMTPAQARKFLSILNSFLDDIGALG